MTNAPTDAGASFADITKYTYGTTGLGDESISRADRVKLVRAIMETGVWFHTSDTYGSAMSILRDAFAEDRAHIPSMIFKVGLGADTRDQLRETIVSQLKATGVDRLQIAQLCVQGQVAEDLRTGGKTYEKLRDFQAEGIVERYVFQVFPHESEIPLVALRAGYLKGIIDGFIFYFNPLQRYARNPLWDAIQETNSPFIGMRTTCGGTPEIVRDHPEEHAWMRARAATVIPIYERSGCKSWTEFSVRYAYGFPLIRSTVGSTMKLDHFNMLLESAKDPKPLPADIRTELVNLNYRWSDEQGANF